MASGGDPEKAIENISKGTDRKQDLMLLMDAHNKWDHFFLPAPMSICLLGQLLMVSADRDISLRDREPQDGFKYLKYPDSFRACLVQISNGGWSAFNQAHSSMDQIRLHTKRVEPQVSDALKILLKGNLSEIKFVVPTSLSAVSEIADECKCLAERTENKFVEVMHLCNEVLEACTAAKGHYEESTRKTKEDIARASLEKERSETWSKRFEVQLEKQEKELERAQNRLDECMKDLPSTASIVGTHVVQGIMDTATHACSAVSLFFLSNYVGPTKVATNVLERKVETTLYEREAETKFYEREAEDRSVSFDVRRVVPHIKGIGQFFNADGMLNSKEIVDEIAKQTQKILESDKKSIAKDSGKMKDSLRKKVKEAISLCGDVIKHTKRGKKDPSKEKKIYERFQVLKKAACTLEAHANKGANYPFPPQPSVCQEKVKAVNTLPENAIENARFKTEMAKSCLEEAQKNRDKMFADLREENDKLHKAIVELKTLNIAEINFNKIQDILRKGLAALANVRSQWEKLCQFFQMISNLIKVALKRSFTSFVDYARGGAAVRLKKELMSETYKEIFINQATEANRIAFVVHNISTAYVEISTKHLMPGITSLGKLLHLDSVNDEREMILKREELQSSMQSAQDYITSLMEKNKRDFDRRLNARINRIKNEVEAILPPLPPPKIEEIKETVRDGFTKDDDELKQKLDDLL